MATERIKMARAVEITGEAARSLQAAAAAGLIPGAARPFKAWTFDEAKLRAWLKTKERQPPRAEAPRQYVRPPTRGTLTLASEAHYQQAMKRLRSLGRRDA